MSAFTAKRSLPGPPPPAKNAPTGKENGVAHLRCRCSLSANPYPLDPVCRGFTLIEILVVLVIVGVLALAVTIGIASAGGERQLTREAERFQALVAYACTRAELSGHEIGVRVDVQGYAFVMLGLDGWTSAAQQELRPRKWIHGLAASMLREGREIRLADGDDALPQIVCFSSGELSPFLLRLQLGDVVARYELSGRSDGRIDLRAVAQ